MKKELKEFFLRGFLFAGLGPLTLSVIYLILHYNIELSLTGIEVFLAIVSTYIIAFVQAGTSVFHQIESWSSGNAIGLQLLLMYFAYLFLYLVNRWLEFSWIAILIFTLVFILVYLFILLIVYLLTKKSAENLNKMIK